MALLQARLNQTRARLYSGHLQGADLQQAQGELAKELSEKDYYQCLIDVLFAPQGPGDLGPGSDGLNQMGMGLYKSWQGFDGNIPPMASGSFNNWCGAVKDHFKIGIKDLSAAGVVRRYNLALEAVPTSYQGYEIVRDWSEYAAHGHNITDDPKGYGVFLVAIGAPWSRSANPESRAVILQRSADYYKAMAALFGREAMEKGARTIMAATKNGGGLNPPLRLNGAAYTRPWPAFWAAIGETSLRNYALVQLAFFPTGDASTLSIHDLNEAEAEYNQLVVTHGQEKVISAVQKVHDAPKNVSGRLSDARLIGVSNEIPKRAIEDLLSHPDSAPTLSAAGVENPDYQGWARFKAGAVSVYGEDRGFRSRRDIQVRTLRSLNATGATVTNSMGEIDSSPGSLYLHDNQMSVPAYLPPAAGPTEPSQAGGSSGSKAAVSRSSSEGEVAPVGYTPVSQAGSETLKINGKVFVCQWQKQGQQITWRSSEVPGGLVLQFNYSYLVYQPQLASAAAIRSINDIRFDITSLSDGPYGQTHSSVKSATPVSAVGGSRPR